MARSIWSTRMTVLRMIMPASAIRPSSATNPNGRLEISSAPVAPIRPSGAVTNTSASREKLCSWIISRLNMAIAIGQRRFDVGELGQPLVGDVGRLHVVDDVAAHGEHGVAVAPPQDRLLI